MAKLAKLHKVQDTIPVLKVDTERRLVFGWAQVCKVDGEDYYDTDNQCIPEDVALDGWNDFMQTTKVMKAMHSGEQMGEVRFAFPMMLDIAKSLGVNTDGKSGMIVAVYVADDGMLLKFQTGEYKGFSIGGGAAWKDVE